VGQKVAIISDKPTGCKITAYDNGHLVAFLFYYLPYRREIIH